MKLNIKIILFITICVIILSNIVIYSNANSIKDENIKLPILMYHSILKDPTKHGKYVISPTQFEEDLIYISNNGYTTITMTDLIEHVYNNIELPEKPIIITFDDGYYNNLTYAVPLLEKYNMKAIISIVGEYTDTFSKTNESNPNYGYLKWDDIRHLIPLGCIEFRKSFLFFT